MSLIEKYSGRILSTDEYAVAITEIDRKIKELENIKLEHGGDYLLLKWGGWKSWNSDNKKIQELFKQHDELGLNVSAMLQHDTDKQKDILCQIVDLIDGSIQNDWDGDYYTKNQAKGYIMGYSNERS